MNLNLQKDLVFFDVETTGLNVIRDRIVQIGLVKIAKGTGETRELALLINPGIPISAESMSIHGIMPSDLANKPTFQQVAKQIFDFIGASDLAGYNSNRFDIPMLMEEFDRAGIDFDISKRKIIDVQRIFYKMEPRTLRAALQFYCGKEMEDAHDALADVKATIDVFKGQLEKYKDKDLIDEEGNLVPEPIKNDIPALHEFTNDLKMVDVTQKLKYDMKGEIIFNFGKYMGQGVKEVFVKDRQYYHWILEKEFSVQVKQTARRLMKELEKSGKN